MSFWKVLRKFKTIIELCKVIKELYQLIDELWDDLYMFFRKNGKAVEFLRLKNDLGKLIEELK